MEDEAEHTVYKWETLEVKTVFILPHLSSPAPSICLFLWTKKKKHISIKKKIQNVWNYIQ